LKIGDFPAFQADLEKVKWDAKNRQDRDGIL